ncbi:MAG: hypothetical protein NT003_04180 [Candidatus Magasanikbacteria bacterium]|nr:hypothetical protein [Candidatus Magasanikbacteria bacterium]
MHPQREVLYLSGAQEALEYTKQIPVHMDMELPAEERLAFLTDMMWTVECQGSSIPFSIGARWLSMFKFAATAYLFNDSVEQVLIFLRNFFAVPYCVEVLCDDEQFVEFARKSSDFEQFFLDAYGACVRRSRDMIKIARVLGISNEKIGQAILARLVNAHAVVQTENPHVSEFRNFLEYGGELISRYVKDPDLRLSSWKTVMDPDREWSILKECGLLEAALRECAAKAPHLITTYHDFMIARGLSSEFAKEVCEASAGKLVSVQHQNLAYLNSLPLEIRLALALRLPTKDQYNAVAVMVPFVTQVMFDLDQKQMVQYHEMLFAKLTQFSPITVMKLMYPLLKVIGPDDLGKRVTKFTLQAWLDEKGFTVSRVVMRPHENRKTGRMESRAQIEMGEDICMHEAWHSHRYFPAAGDLVIVDTGHAQRIARNVWVKMFDLVEEASKK